MPTSLCNIRNWLHSKAETTRSVLKLNSCSKWSKVLERGERISRVNSTYTRQTKKKWHNEYFKRLCRKQLWLLCQDKNRYDFFSLASYAGFNSRSKEILQTVPRILTYLAERQCVSTLPNPLLASERGTEDCDDASTERQVSSQLWNLEKVDFTMKFPPCFLLEQTEVTTSLRNRYCTTKMCCRTLPSKISSYFNEHTVISAVQSSAEKQKKKRRKRQNFQRLSITKGTETPIITGLKLALTRECPEVQFHRLAALKILYSPSSQKLLMESCIYITEVQKGPLHTHWAIFSFIVHILFITIVNIFIVFHLSVILK